MKNYLKLGDKVKILVDKTISTPLGIFVCKKGQIYRVCHIGVNFASIEINNFNGDQDTIEFSFDELELVK